LTRQQVQFFECALQEQRDALQVQIQRRETVIHQQRDEIQTVTARLLEVEDELREAQQQSSHFQQRLLAGQDELRGSVEQYNGPDISSHDLPVSNLSLPLIDDLPGVRIPCRSYNGDKKMTSLLIRAVLRALCSEDELTASNISGAKCDFLLTQIELLREFRFCLATGYP
jgi:hypothetical protein